MRGEYTPFDPSVDSGDSGGKAIEGSEEEQLQQERIGGVHIAMRLCELAHVLGFRIVVVDPRRVFATGERFPGVDELVHAWPQEALRDIPLTSQTAVCALTHDPKIDVPALEAALDSPAFYIGSLGRTTTQLARYRALKQGGRTDEEIDRIYGPSAWTCAAASRPR